MKHTPVRIESDAQGPCMIMHPQHHGLAIASLTDTFKPTEGFYWHSEHDENWPEERNAFARLISAAPEMLEALKGLSAEVRNNPKHTGMTLVWLGRAEAAIKKAEGNQ